MYTCIISKEAYKKVEVYLDKLKTGNQCGSYLKEKLFEYETHSLEVEEFLEILINTKRPQIFAESAIAGNGLDWNLEELSILGDLGIAVPVTIFDNGQHRMPDVHSEPFLGHLLYIPGALLSSFSETPADWDEVVNNGEIDLDAYSDLYERRLFPLLKFAADSAGRKNRKAFISIPGLGCGQFAGPFRRTLGNYLKKAIRRILIKHSVELMNIRAIYYDPYEECENEKFEIDGISFLVRPLTRGNHGKSQLSQVQEFNEAKDDFSECELFSVVAWDHVSWPGNDYYSGSRVTDDGVKAAATDSMSVMTGINGFYDTNRFKYMPPSEYSCWREVVYTNEITIKLSGNLIVL